MNKRTLNQVIKWNEDVAISGIGSMDKAEDLLDTMFAMGDTFACLKPRIAAYRSSKGKRYAILETDTSAKEY